MRVNKVRKINIMETSWSVTVSRRAITKVTKKARSQGVIPKGAVAGLTNCLNGRIYVAPEGPESHRRAVLWHEVWHAAYESIGGLRLGPEASEDDVIMQLSQPLLATLRQNGPLTAALLEGSEASAYMRAQA